MPEACNGEPLPPDLEKLIHSAMFVKTVEEKVTIESISNGEIPYENKSTLLLVSVSIVVKKAQDNETYYLLIQKQDNSLLSCDELEKLAQNKDFLGRILEHFDDECDIRRINKIYLNKTDLYWSCLVITFPDDYYTKGEFIV